MTKVRTAMLLVAALLFGSLAMAGTAAAVEAPALITSAGQSPGALMVRVLADQAGVANVFDATVGPEALADAKSFIVVIGASMKGLGAAGIDVADEFARIEPAGDGQGWASRSSPYVEGGPRRGHQRRPVPAGLPVRRLRHRAGRGGNDDGFFSDLAAEFGVTLETVEDRGRRRGAADALRELTPAGTGRTARLLPSGARRLCLGRKATTAGRKARLLPSGARHDFCPRAQGTTSALGPRARRLTAGAGHVFCVLLPGAAHGHCGWALRLGPRAVQVA